MALSRLSQDKLRKELIRNQLTELWRSENAFGKSFQYKSVYLKAEFAFSGALLKLRKLIVLLS